MGDALDIEMELLNALGGEEETRAESASLGARGPPEKVETQTTTAEDDLLEEVEAMERVATHRPAGRTPFMSSPMKHEPEEGGAMEIDLKVRTTSFDLTAHTQYKPVLSFHSDPRSPPRPPSSSLLNSPRVPRHARRPPQSPSLHPSLNLPRPHSPFVPHLLPYARPQ